MSPPSLWPEVRLSYTILISLALIIVSCAYAQSEEQSARISESFASCLNGLGFVDYAATTLYVCDAPISWEIKG